MEPTQSSTPEKEKSSLAPVNETKTSEAKTAQPHGAVFPVLFAVAALLFAGALFFSLQQPKEQIENGNHEDIVVDMPDNTSLQQPKEQIENGNHEDIVVDMPDNTSFDVETNAPTTEEVSSSKTLPDGTPHLHLLSPKPGESLCLGEDYIIKWEGPKELSTVSLWVKKGMEAAWGIEDLPATFNESNTPGKGEFVWKVGTSKRETIPEGYAYTLGISGNYPQSMRKTPDFFQMDKPLSIINCQG